MSIENVTRDEGRFYVTQSTGKLLFFRDLKRDGTNAADGSTGWHERSGSPIGQGWNAFSKVLSGDVSEAGGIIYAINVDGFLLYYRDQARNGTPEWAFNGIGQTIRSGWFLSPSQTTALVGYCVPISVVPGETIEFKVSARSDYDVAYFRLKAPEDGETGIPLMEPFSVEAGTQDIPPQAWQNGCRWETSFTLEVPEDWPSGIYAARLVATDDTETHLVFVVRPGGINGLIWLSSPTRTPGTPTMAGVAGQNTANPLVQF